MDVLAPLEARHSVQRCRTGLHLGSDRDPRDQPVTPLGHSRHRECDLRNRGLRNPALIASALALQMPGIWQTAVEELAGAPG